MISTEHIIENPKQVCQCAPSVYSCNTCEYSTDRKSSYDAHIITNKHAKNKSIESAGGTVIVKHRQKKNREVDLMSDKLFNCGFCKKPYGSRNGLWSQMHCVARCKFC